MPLSEHEQALLDQMEQALYAEDPRFANQMQGAARRSHTRHLIGLLGSVVGLGLVLVGINTTWVLGGLGFAIMVAALAYAFAPARKAKPALGTVRADGSIRSTSAKAARVRGRTGSRSRHPSRSGGPAARGTFMQRMEARWERRRNTW